MDKVICFKELFESISDYIKIVFLMFLNKKDDDFLQKCGYIKNVINCICLEIKKMLMEQNEEYLDCNINEGESISERILNK